MEGFEGKKALVTGGSRGIGRAISLLLASRGTDIAINYVKDEDAAASTVSEIEKLGRRCLAIKADISDPKEIKEMFRAIREEFSPLDFFVSNAVSGVIGPADGSRPREVLWQEERDEADYNEFEKDVAGEE